MLKGRVFLGSLSLVVNTFAIFSNANILKHKTIQRYHIEGIGCPLLISINIVFDQETEKSKKNQTGTQATSRDEPVVLQD